MRSKSSWDVGCKRKLRWQGLAGVQDLVARREHLVELVDVQVCAGFIAFRWLAGADLRASHAAL